MAAVLALAPTGQRNSAEARDDAESPRLGSYTLSVTTTAVVGPDRAASYSHAFGPDEPQDFEIVVPERYDPDHPPGVLVYISPTDSGRIRSSWASVLESENLIWIAANQSGNNRLVARRVAHAILALEVVRGRYDIDAARVYLAGFSGGARVSGLAAASCPDLFPGAIYIGGAEMWDQNDAAIDLEAMRRNRYVFMAGSKDFNRSMTRRVFRNYADLGIENVSFILMSLKGHELPDERQMLKAIRFLDGRQE
jgi:predicted esterase